MSKELLCLRAASAFCSKKGLAHNYDTHGDKQEHLWVSRVGISLLPIMQGFSEKEYYNFFCMVLNEWVWSDSKIKNFGIRFVEDFQTNEFQYYKLQ